MTLDQAIRDRIEQDFETSLCVEAGAGTGKTSLMVRRVVNQVLQGIPLSRIAAITFTEKAAGELKQRIRAALESERSKSSEHFDPLSRALRELDTAQISTIHGFAAAILRERPVEAIVDPNFSQLDELGLSLLLDQIWERWLDAKLASSNEVLKLALAADLNPDRLCQLFRSLYDHREYIAGLAASPYSFDRAREETSRILREAESFLQFCRDQEDTAWQQWTRTLQSFRGVSAMHPAGLVKFFKELKLDKNAGNKTRWQRDYCRKLREEADALRKIRGNFHASLLSGVLLLLREAVGDAEEEKSRRNVLDFDDLLLKARDLLRRDRATRGYFQEMFLSVIVDEFQDTDPLQVEIVFFLCEQQPQAGCWEEVVLKPGKLCIVGDPKQSIYRFRRADIEIYMKAQNRISRQGELLPIQENFRSARPLVNWVNNVFSRLIQEEENYQPRYQRLLTSDQSSSSPVPRVTLLCSSGEPKSVKECRQQEAAALVSLLRRIRQERWPLRRREAGKPPEAQWGDIAVLFSTLTESLIYESALRAAEIPYRLDGGRQFFARQEIHALVACLQAIDDPADEIALVAALRSLFFGISDDEIFRHRRRAGALSYYGRGSLPPEEGAAAPEGDRELGRALLLLRTLHEERNLVSIAFTLERLYRDTDALEKHLLTWSGRQAVANLQKAVLRARAFEEAGAATFRRFVRWLYRLEEFGRQEPESTLVETDDDAVGLLTIHKAKGLEFPVVILANLSGGMHDGVSVLLNRKLSSLEFHISAGDDGGKTVLETSGFQEMKEKERERQEAEKRRLLYVAATRARDYLVVSTFHVKNRPGLLEHLLPALPGASSIPDGAQEVVVDPACEQSNLRRESLATVVARRQQAEKTEAEREAAPVRLWRVPPCALPPDPELSSSFESVPETDPDWETQLRRWRNERATLFERASVSWSPSTASAAKAGNETIASFAAPAAAIAYDSSRLGSAFHRLMYRIPAEHLTNPGVADRLRPLADQIALEYALPDAGELLKLARRPMPEPLAERLRSAGRIHREVPFLLQLPAEFAREGKKAPALYEGIIDLVAEQADGSLLIVDYKTDRVAAGEIPARMARYAEQARIYRAAAERGSGRNVRDVCFFFIRPGAVVGMKN